jgi:Fur family peroxide stress response transcriptional regulator
MVCYNYTVSGTRSKTKKANFALKKNERERLGKFIALSRKKGLKLTPQRIIIFRILSELDGHLSADDVYQRAKKDCPMISATTVYRNLEKLVGVGLLSYLERSGTAVRYDANPAEHHHFICGRCESVRDIYLKAVKYELDREKSSLGRAKIDISKLYLHGVCQDCLDDLSNSR